MASELYLRPQLDDAIDWQPEERGGVLRIAGHRGKKSLAGHRREWERFTSSVAAVVDQA